MEYIHPNGLFDTDTLECFGCSNDKLELQMRLIPDAFDLCNAVVGDP